MAHLPFMSSLKQAIRLLRQGDWEGAHRIAQAQSGVAADWTHAVTHALEGDLANADYWYRRARRTRPEPFDREREITALARFVEAGQGT